MPRPGVLGRLCYFEVIEAVILRRDSSVVHLEGGEEPQEDRPLRFPAPAFFFGFWVVILLAELMRDDSTIISMLLPCLAAAPPRNDDVGAVI